MSFMSLWGILLKLSMKKLDDFYKAHAPFSMKGDENSFGKVMLEIN